MPPRIEHNNHEDYETEPQENNYPGPIFPDCSKPIRELGPIHAAARYTVERKK
jgi:hypothetical protein